MVRTENAVIFYNLSPEQSSKVLAFAEGLKKKTKSKKEEAEEETEEVEDEEIEASDEEETEDDADAPEDGDETEAEEDEGPTLKEVIAALGKYADKNGRPAAMKILAKFGVKSTHKLKKTDYQKVIDLTKKKKQ